MEMPEPENLRKLTVPATGRDTGEPTRCPRILAASGLDVRPGIHPGIRPGLMPERVGLPGKVKILIREEFV